MAIWLPNDNAKFVGIPQDKAKQTSQFNSDCVMRLHSRYKAVQVGGLLYKLATVGDPYKAPCQRQGLRSSLRGETRVRTHTHGQGGSKQNNVAFATVVSTANAVQQHPIRMVPTSRLQTKRKRCHLYRHHELRHVRDLVRDAVHVRPVLYNQRTHGPAAHLQRRRTVVVRVVPECPPGVVARDSVQV